MVARADTIRTHMDYTAWASQKLVGAAAQLTAEELTHNFHTADRSVLGTLVHIYAADRVWLGRIQGNPPTQFIDPEKDMHLSILQTEWPALHQRWKDWAAGLNDNTMQTDVRYKDLKGNPYATPLWQILLHVVNHATHHRGQVSGFLRALGHSPPPLDLIYYYRQLS